ncbi:hypothetical protein METBISCDRAFT_24157 [Metschnikowia bicuspidata]|uniref:Uncharacterized protein n=1 Tax=Metschnikowia bicuspidata TaxID=27322 RepID=A0A4P9Z9X9_9ASCO|nr:hypothetical protein METBISCDRAFT_24157 [Metschnikowia bicuspidata]
MELEHISLAEDKLCFDRSYPRWVDYFNLIGVSQNMSTSPYCRETRYFEVLNNLKILNHNRSFKLKDYPFDQLSVPPYRPIKWYDDDGTCDVILRCLLFHKAEDVDKYEQRIVQKVKEGHGCLPDSPESEEFVELFREPYMTLAQEVNLPKRETELKWKSAIPWKEIPLLLQGYTSLGFLVLPNEDTVGGRGEVRQNFDLLRDWGYDQFLFKGVYLVASSYNENPPTNDPLYAQYMRLISSTRHLCHDKHIIGKIESQDREFITTIFSPESFLWTLWMVKNNLYTEERVLREQKTQAICRWKPPVEEFSCSTEKYKSQVERPVHSAVSLSDLIDMGKPESILSNELDDREDEHKESISGFSSACTVASVRELRRLLGQFEKRRQQWELEAEWLSPSPVKVNSHRLALNGNEIRWYESCQQDIHQPVSHLNGSSHSQSLY